MDGTGESWFAVSLPPPVFLELISLQPSSLAAGICVFLVDLSTGPPAPPMRQRSIRRSVADARGR